MCIYFCSSIIYFVLVRWPIFINAVKSIDFVDSSVDAIQFPFSDGGEGALPVIQKHVAHKLIECVTQDAMGNLIKASYFINDNKTAWIELYKATGLADMPVEKRNITLTSTFGKGLTHGKGCYKHGLYRNYIRFWC